IACAVVTGRRRSETRMPPPRRLARAAGTFLAHPTCAPAEVRMDTFGAWAQSRAARSGRVAAALPLPALCTAGRRHGELRRRWRRGRAALRFLRRVSSARSGATPMERRPAARSATRTQGAPENPAQLPPGERMAARAGGHALPAPGLGARGRRARARLHLFDRLSRAVSSGSRAGISRLPPGAGGVRRAVRGPGSRACAPRRGDSEKDGATGCRRSWENSLAHEGRGAFSRRVPVRAQAPNRVFAAAQSTLAPQLLRAVPHPGPAPGPAHQDAVPGAGLLRERRAGRTARTLAKDARASRRRTGPSAGDAPAASASSVAIRLVPRRVASHRRAP